MESVTESIAQIDRYLVAVRSRNPEHSRDSEIARLTVELKRQAVENDEQELAKKLWCYHAVHRCQNRYIHSFFDMKEGYYFGAWLGLENVESALEALDQQFELDVDGVDRYKLLQIRNNTEQFQRLFPYSLFFSIGAVIHETQCSICEQPISLRKPCVHRVGEIYSGEMCSRVVTRADLLEVSLVERPAQRCTVPFDIDNDTGKAIDLYNYAHLNYAVNKLQHPFSKWHLKVHRRKRLVSDFSHVGRNEYCPCGSRMKFKKCCMRKKYLMRNHYDIGFQSRPGEQMPPVLDYGVVRGKPRFPYENRNNGK